MKRQRSLGRNANRPTNKHMQIIRGNNSICSAGNERTFFPVQNHSEFIYGRTWWLALLNEIHFGPTEKFSTQKFDSWTNFQNAKIHNFFFLFFHFCSHFCSLFHISPGWGTQERIERPQISTRREMRMKAKMKTREKEKNCLFCCNLNSIHDGLKMNFNWNASTSTYN